MAGKNVEVEESGRVLKVHTHTPHLVSLGGGRWSTAVTLHQIPEGRQSLGSTQASDIMVKGKGVEPVHCYVENEQGAVTLYPLENGNVSVDGTTISMPTKLTQGSTLCIGKNSSFRYNNPAEASVIKKSLSDSFRRKCKRSKSKSPSHDSWESNASAEEILANLISPKVFPSNSVTVNSPASVVLGPNKFPTNLNGKVYVKPSDLEFNVNSYQNQNPTSPISPILNRTITTPSPSFDRNPTYQTPKSSSKTVSDTINDPMNLSYEKQNGRIDLEAEQVRLEEILNLCTDYEKQIQWERNHKPQPNRIITNGSLPRDKRLNSPTVVPSPVRDQSFSFDNMNGEMTMSAPGTPLLSHPGSPRTRIKTTVGHSESNTPLSSIKQTENSLDILEKKLALLNDIDYICNINKTSKPLSHNQLPTNNNQFVQDKSTSTAAPNKHKFLGLNQHQPNGVARHNDNTNDLMSRSFHGTTSNNIGNDITYGTRGGTNLRYNHSFSHRTNNYQISEDPSEDIESMTSPNDVMSKSYHGTLMADEDDNGKENISMNNSNIMSRSYNGNVFDKNNEHNHKNTNKYLFNTSPTKSNNTSNIYNHYATLKKDSNNENKNNTNSQSALYYTNSIDRRTNGNNPSTKQISNLNNKQEILEKEKEKIEGLVNELEALAKSPNKNTVTSTTNRNLPNMKSFSSVHLRNGVIPPSDTIIGSIKNGVPQGVSLRSNVFNKNVPNNNNVKSISTSNISSLNNEHLKFILPLEDIDCVLKKQRASLNGDIEELKEKRFDMLNELSDIKAKVQDIQQQEEELSRELELERALLEGESKSENEFLIKEEKRVQSLKDKIIECEQQMEKCKAQQKDRQLHCKQSLEQQQSVLKTLQQQVKNCSEQLKDDLNESITQQQELLESEKKSFEDLEFSLLEEEADWLSRREELQREMSDAKLKLEERKSKLLELSSQREQISRNAVDDTTDLNSQLMTYLRKIEETRNKLREIDIQLKDISKIKGLAFTPTSTDTEEDINENKQSQDDIDRITRVTSDNPMVEVNSNSLGRRTIASLQEIEKHRQLHLAKQGSLVIEEERKRVLELKKRVQEEVKMQWENEHKKVSSDDSLPPSIDTSESRMMEDFEKVGDHIMSSSSVSPDSMYSKSITSSSCRDQKEDRDPESRPMSESSAYSEDQLSVKLRNKSSNNVQRPLTRFLPHYGDEIFDLRQHIEAAGHLPDLCSHLTIDSTSCRGYLNKMAGRFHHWNKRWFVFDRNKKCLSYYADRSEKKQRGSTSFRCIEEAYVDHLNSVKSPNPHLTFIVKSNDRTFHLMAQSPEAMRIWIDVIFSGAEGYQQFGHG